MNTHVKITAAALFFFFMSSSLFTQTIIRGRVIDGFSLQGLPNVNISVPALPTGTISGEQGMFSLEIPDTSQTLTFSRVGYVRRQVPVDQLKAAGDERTTITLAPSVVGLDEVSVISSMAVDRRTPVSVSTISAQTIENELGDQPLPRIAKMVPGVYPSRTGGGSGDAAINIRGFKQENIALLLNGIPISSVENGLVYWNNWLGLADATRQIQIQRGLGASKVALNSVGGTINIITRTSEANKGGKIGYSITDYGNSRFTFSYNTGKLDKGMSISFLGSRIWGPGYVDATYVRAWGYFLSVTQEFNKNHKLVFVGLGNPERHGQRSIMLSSEETDRYGLKFNKDWGSMNGQINNASENFYHKPHLSLNHYWNVSEKTFLATSAYFSPGYGGGKWSDSFMADKSVFEYRNPSQQIDWAGIYRDNYNNTDPYVLASGDTVTGYSKNIQTSFLAGHIWTGLISTLEHDLNENFNFMAGIHYRYFRSTLRQKVRDLLGGDFFIDNYAWAVDGPAGRNEIKHVGDIIKIDNGAIIHFANLFGQLEYASPPFSAFVSGSYSYNWYQREDRYNYVEDIRSEVVERGGYNLKAGVNHNINQWHNIYLNGGYFSRVPYYKFIFANFTNEPSTDIENEQITSFEIGYGLNSKSTRIRLNVYHTYWKDKSILANEYNQFLDPVMISGLDALHRGVELEISHTLTDNISLGGLISLGDWKWKNNVTAEVFDQDNVLKDTVEIYANGLYVGDAPQNQYGLFASMNFLKNFNLKANWIWYDKLFADFDPVSRNDPQDDAQSYEIPAYGLLDVHLGFSFKVADCPAHATFSCYNVTDKEHILRGLDGKDHSPESFRGYWGFGRTFNLGISLSF